MNYYAKTGPTKIIHNLYIGGEKDVNNLLNLGVVNIIDLRNKSNNNISIPTDKLINYIEIPMYDGLLELDKVEKKFKSGVNYLNQLIKDKTAVICHEGKSRSASLILLYLLSNGYKPQEAENFLYNKRPIIAIHPDLKEIIDKFTF